MFHKTQGGKHCIIFCIGSIYNFVFVTFKRASALFPPAVSHPSPWTYVLLTSEYLTSLPWLLTQRRYQVPKNQMLSWQLIDRIPVREPWTVALLKVLTLPVLLYCIPLELLVSFLQWLGNESVHTHTCTHTLNAEGGDGGGQELNSGKTYY